MKAKMNLLLAGTFALLLAACSSTDTMDTDDSAMEDASARETAPVVVGTGNDAAVDSMAIPADQTIIGGSSVSNGGAMVAIADTTVYFDFDLSTLSPQTRAALTRVAAALRSTTGDIRVEGHADERGTREYNIALGERRAKTAADFLVLQGVSASRIETISYGEERPEANGTGEMVWSQNRRVEIK
jgi:peptidoglycan-associated lipoprotein